MQRKPEMGKYLLWRFFHRNSEIRRYLPATQRFSRNSFTEFMKTYPFIYIKPVAGSQGRGILKAWKQNGKIFIQKTINQPKSFESVDQAHQYLVRGSAGKAYIVQQGIHLARIDNRPFDIRVMMQREKPGGKWLYSGMLAKIAGKGSVVTNVALSKGTVMEVEKALQKSLGWESRRVDTCVQRLIDIGFLAAKHFDSYLLYRELGFDMAVDKNGRIWMIEQNTLPSHLLFRHLKSDLSMYQKIQSRWARYQQKIKRQA